MELKDKMKDWRKTNKVTQVELAKKMGVSRSNIAEVEVGNLKGGIDFLNKLSMATGVSIAYWVGEDLEGSYNAYEALDVLIDAMLENKMIKEDGKIEGDALKLVITVLEKEIKLKIKRNKERG